MSALQLGLSDHTWSRDGGLLCIGSFHRLCHSKRERDPGELISPLSVKPCDLLGLIKKIHGLPRTPDLYRTELKETFCCFFSWYQGIWCRNLKDRYCTSKGICWGHSEAGLQFSFLNTWTEPNVLKWLLGCTGIINIYMNVTPLLLLCLMSALLARETFRIMLH